MTLGLATQTDLDAEVAKASRRLERERKEAGLDIEKAGASLLPTAQTIPGLGPQPTMEILEPRIEKPREETESEETARMLARLKEMKGSPETEQPVEE